MSFEQILNVVAQEGNPINPIERVAELVIPAPAPVESNLTRFFRSTDHALYRQLGSLVDERALLLANPNQVPTPRQLEDSAIARDQLIERIATTFELTADERRHLSALFRQHEAYGRMSIIHHTLDTNARNHLLAGGTLDAAFFDTQNAYLNRQRDLFAGLGITANEALKRYTEDAVRLETAYTALFSHLNPGPFQGVQIDGRQRMRHRTPEARLLVRRDELRQERDSERTRPGVSVMESLERLSTSEVQFLARIHAARTGPGKPVEIPE